MIKKITRRAGMAVSSADIYQTGTVTNAGLEAASTEYNWETGVPALIDAPKYLTRTDDWYGRTSATQVTTYEEPVPVAGGIMSKIVVQGIAYKTVSHATGDYKDGLVRETSVELDQPTGDPVFAKTEYFWESGPAFAGGRQNAVVKKIEVTNDAGLTKKTEFLNYDNYNNPSIIKECGYSAPGHRVWSCGGPLHPIKEAVG